MGYFRKNLNRGWGWGHGISKGIEQRMFVNSGCQLKRKWNFQGYTRKNYVIFMGLGFRSSNFQRVSNNFAEFPGMKAYFLWNLLGNFFLEFLSDKSKNSRGFFRKIYPQLLCLDFCCNSPMLLILIAILTINDMQNDASDMLWFLLEH